MKGKHIVALGILAISILFVGCKGTISDSVTHEQSTKGETKHFEVLYKQRIGWELDTYDVGDHLIRVRDVHTGEEFMIYEGDKKGGITECSKQVYKTNKTK